ncbi:MAG: aspartate 1-decarboxylase [Candidatus Omnitrophota bacterium]|nr:aspartate 1-decarboxylase [Candidatus Omnitrophota bacterium]
MLHTFCKSKIAKAKVTNVELFYEGSVTIDKLLLEKANITPGEKVELLNLNNGSRVETYAIEGKKGSGVICLNGPAARSGCVGDELVILCYCLVDSKELKTIKTKVVYVNSKNHPRD